MAQAYIPTEQDWSCILSWQEEPRELQNKVTSATLPSSSSLMKMDLAKVRGCLAVSILPLLLLVDPTAACYCLDSPPIDLQTAYCISDVVISGRFLEAGFAREDMSWAVYEFKVDEVFKGPFQAGQTVVLYTQILGTTCGYRYTDPFDTPYLVTGILDGDLITISVCSFIRPWAELTSNEMDGLADSYSSNCN